MAKIKLSERELKKYSKIVAEETGEDEYLYSSLMEHNKSITPPAPGGMQKLLWGATHRFFGLTFFLCMVLGIVVIGLPFYLFLGDIGISVGAGIFAGFLLGGVVVAGARVSPKSCETCKSLKTNEVYYRHLLYSKDELENRDIKDEDGEVYGKSAVVVRNEVFAIYKRCERCGALSMDIEVSSKDK